MRISFVSCHGIYIAMLSIAFMGCGDSGSGVEKKPGVEGSLADLSNLLVLLSDQKQALPLKQADLDKYEPTAPYAVLSAKKTEIVYLWGTGIISSSTAVIAYDAKAPSDGGSVLLQNGTLKTMTAAEFATAPKAAKK